MTATKKKKKSLEDRWSGLVGLVFILVIINSLGYSLMFFNINIVTAIFSYEFSKIVYAIMGVSSVFALFYIIYIIIKTYIEKKRRM